MTTVFTAARSRLTLGPEVARGGEGVVWRVRERPGAVAKLYAPRPPARAAEKLEAMLARRPEDPTAARLGHTSIAWPTEPLFDGRGEFVGYVMPGIFDGRPLVDVYNRKRRALVMPGFDRRYLHRTATNFAVAIGALHGHGLVVGDLNESNVLVRPNALVALIDTDSYQVPNLKGRQPLIFPCPVGKTEFTPPELQGKPFAGAVRTPEHDRFALAVLIFQLLMEGSHPFRAKWLGAGEPASTDQKISLGLFPHAKSPLGPVAPPPGLPPLDALHPAIAELMRRCFVDGHRQPTLRPLPSEWERALTEGERTLVRCPNGHYYGGHLRACSWCADGPVRAPGTVRRPAREERDREAPRRPPLLPAPTVQPVSTTTMPAPRTNRGSWRNAMMVAVTTVVILTLFMQGLLSTNRASLPAGGPVETDRSTTTGEDPYDLQPGSRVRTTSELSAALLYERPERPPTGRLVTVGSILEITGPWQRGPNGIWWPVREVETGQEGYILQRFIAPLVTIRQSGR